MAGKKRRKRRAHRTRGATTIHGPARQRQAAPAGSRPASLIGAPSGDAVAAVPKPRPEPVMTSWGSQQTSLPAGPAFGRLGHVPTVLLPGRAFFAMGRPVAGLVCCVLQASLLGWVPAALWAVRVERRAATKQRGLAARLRPL